MLITHRPRPGIRLVEVLVVIALAALTIGLLMPAIGTHRRIATCTQCINNLKQIGLAVHNYASAYQSALPALTSDMANPEYGTYNGGIFLTLLPFLEESVLFQKGALALPRCTWAGPIPPNVIMPFGTVQGSTSPRPLYSQPLKFYICPTDDTVINQNSANQNQTSTGQPYYYPWAACSYAANYQVFGVLNNFASPINPSNAAAAKYNIGNVPDGNSNTVFFGEVFSACSTTAGSLWAYPGIANYSDARYGNPGYPALDTDAASPTFGAYNPAGANGLGDTASKTTSYLWAPVFANSNQLYGFPLAAPGGGAGSYALLTYWDAPPQAGANRAICDKARLQSYHTNAVTVGLGDGSVRLVNYNVSQATWHAVIVPDDGPALGSDW